MVFKRRNPRSWPRTVAEFLWPRGGWTRAFHYVKHRVRRLPDSPERIARGIWAGVFTTFTPLYGLHFLVAALLSRLMQGNIVASLMATFFGNPLTYVPIAISSLTTGHWLLGTQMDEKLQRSLDAPATTGHPAAPEAGGVWGFIEGLWHKFLDVFSGGEGDSLGTMFVDAATAIFKNFKAIFTEDVADWSSLSVFYDEVFFPYLIGGILPGILTASVCYYLSVPVIRAYQKRRKGAIKAKLEAIKTKAAAKAVAKAKIEQKAD